LDIGSIGPSSLHKIFTGYPCLPSGNSTSSTGPSAYAFPMEREKHMSTAMDLEKSINSNDQMMQQETSFSVGLPVVVIYTSLSRTLSALVKASQLAKSSNSTIEILVVLSIPFALPLEDPSVPLEFVVRQLEEMAAQFPEQIKISVYLCRDQLETLGHVLNRDCPVLVGVRKRLWPTPDERIAHRLQRAGYNVVRVETE
jgi:hypothetical protein